MQKINYDKLKFVKLNNVSRETLILFESYENFLLKQNKHFNLVGSSTIQSVWTRHFADSAKLFSFIHSRAKGTKKTIEVCDVGSGAGFPGIVLSILSLQSKLNISITLFESNKKKAKFLMELTKKLELNTKVYASRVESINKKYDIVCCRALSSLKNILYLTKNCSKKNSLFVLPKGKNWSLEVVEAKKEWSFNIKVVKNNITIDKSGGVTLILNKVRNNK